VVALLCAPQFMPPTIASPSAIRSFHMVDLMADIIDWIDTLGYLQPVEKALPTGGLR